MAENLSGTIERITFHSPETGYAVLRVVARGRRGLVTVVGKLLSVNAGEYIEATGAWAHDPQHGEQFRADEIRCTPPSTVEGIEKYLGSGLVKGIGPKYARKIVEVFGERTLTVIDESPSFLKEIKGIGPQRISQIRESWREQKAVRGIMVFLQSHGLGTARAVRIYKTYGDQAVEIVRDNPYRLATDIWGVGFQTADELGERLGIDRASPPRARAALRFILQQLSKEGHVGCPEEAVIAAAGQVPDLPEAVVRQAVEDLRQEGEVVREPGDPPWLYLKSLFLAELGVARCIHKLRQSEHPLPGPGRRGSRPPRRGQNGPGTGGDAARRHRASRPREGAGHHRRSGRRQDDPRPRHPRDLFCPRLALRPVRSDRPGRQAAERNDGPGGEDHPPPAGVRSRAWAASSAQRCSTLDLDLLVVDESSMVDVNLMYQLLRAVPPHACVVLVGDVDQLPSVGPGSVLADSSPRGRWPVVRLTEIFRQAGQSWIVRAAHAINEGEIPESAPAGGSGDFYFIEADTPEKIVERIVALVRERIPQRFGLDPLRDVQVLTPMNRSELGTQALNVRLQEALNRRGRTGRGGALRLELPRRRQGDADAEQLQQRGVQRRHRPGRAHRRAGARAGQSSSTGAKCPTISASWTSLRWPSR